jgi:hypothetical protein
MFIDVQRQKLSTTLRTQRKNFVGPAPAVCWVTENKQKYQRLQKLNEHTTLLIFANQFIGHVLGLCSSFECNLINGCPPNSSHSYRTSLQQTKNELYQFFFYSSSSICGAGGNPAYRTSASGPFVL